MRVGELFAGIGGFGRGLERAGMRVVWQSEIEPYACAILRKHWPLVANCGDIRAIRAADVAPVDVLCGGFPCQDISCAGPRIGIDGQWSGLWREFARLVRELQPHWVIAENVVALRIRGYDRVADDLETAGYTVWPFVVGADDLGAPHRRKRVWVIAHANAQRYGQKWRAELFNNQQASSCHDVGGCDRAWASADAARTRLAPRLSSTERTIAWRESQQSDGFFDRLHAPEPTIHRVDDGISGRLHENRRPRLAALGNSLVPQIAEAIGRAIMRVEMEFCVR